MKITCTVYDNGGDFVFTAPGCTRRRFASHTRSQIWQFEAKLRRRGYVLTSSTFDRRTFVKEIAR